MTAARRTSPGIGPTGGIATVALALSLLAAGAVPARAPASSPDLLPYLVECIGTAPSGGPDFPTAERPGCRVPIRTREAAVAWRKHDWPIAAEAANKPLGFQVSDAYLLAAAPHVVVAQTFDFGDAPRHFHRYDAGKSAAGGDGGDVLVPFPDGIYIPFTEDGGAGRQWFMGEAACGDGPRPREQFAGWLLFGSDVSADTQARTATLRQVLGDPACPSHFNTAYTQYWRTRLTVPFRVVDGSAATQGTATVDAIVSEHYGRRFLSDHLERFVFAPGLGKIRWERWENLLLTHNDGAGSQSDRLAEERRCPPIPGLDSPGLTWAMADCRTWTNLVRQRPPWAAAAYPWPPPGVTDRLAAP